MDGEVIAATNKTAMLSKCRLRALEAISFHFRKEDTPQYRALALVDLVMVFLEDSNVRVIVEALKLLGANISVNSVAIAAKLSVLLPVIFSLLGDRRAHIKEHANNFLVAVRNNIKPITILSSLCPRIAEVPDRIKTAVLQYLGVTVPYCEEFFTVPANMSIFLIRMSNILVGSQGVKPSSILLSSGKRLLHLVYNVAREVIYNCHHFFIYLKAHRR